MAYSSASPWSVFEVESSSADYSENFSLSSDLQTLTVTDESSSSRLLIGYNTICRPGDLLEFDFEAEWVSGETIASVQIGQFSSVSRDAYNSRARCLVTIDSSSGAGFKCYHLQIIAPSNLDDRMPVKWLVGGDTGQVGVARFRNPKMKVNGKQIGFMFTNSCVHEYLGITSNYVSFLSSNSVEFTHQMQLNNANGFIGNPFLFNIGQIRPATKILGTDNNSSILAIARYKYTDSSSGSGLRLFVSAADGPGLPSEGVVDGSKIGFVDAFFDTGTGHAKAGAINFYYNTTDLPVFSILTPNTSDIEDANGLYIWKTGSFSPKTDGVAECGTASHKWSQVRASSGTIQTSDIRAKDNLEAPSDSLMRAWGKVNFKVFQMKDAIAEKGAGSARLHVGVIAQEVRAAFASEGLDAGRYGLFCYDEWEDQYESDTVIDVEESIDPETGEAVPAQTHVERRLVRAAGSLYGIRYEEALALECAYQRWLGEKRDARIAELEARLAAMEG